MTMTKKELAERLLALPIEIGAAEEAVLAVHEKVTVAKGVLLLKEDDLLINNQLDGKNAETRAAQARQFTSRERDYLAEQELQLKHAVSRLERLRVQFKAYQAVAGLIQVAP